MDIKQIARDALEASLPGLPSDLAAYVDQLIAVGEPDLAIVTLLENAPSVVPTRFVDATEGYFRGSGEYAEREALAAVAKCRGVTQ